MIRQRFKLRNLDTETIEHISEIHGLGDPCKGSYPFTLQYIEIAVKIQVPVNEKGGRMSGVRYWSFVESLHRQILVRSTRMRIHHERSTADIP